VQPNLPDLPSEMPLAIVVDDRVSVWDERAQPQVIAVERFRAYARQSPVQLLQEMLRVLQVRVWDDTD
jgi:hypothetical protein